MDVGWGGCLALDLPSAEGLPLPTYACRAWRLRRASLLLRHGSALLRAFSPSPSRAVCSSFPFLRLPAPFCLWRRATANGWVAESGNFHAGGIFAAPLVPAMRRARDGGLRRRRRRAARGTGAASERSGGRRIAFSASDAAAPAASRRRRAASLTRNAAWRGMRARYRHFRQ